MQDMQDVQIWSLDQWDPLEKEMATHASILAWKPHEQRSLAGYSPWSHKASDKTEWLNTAHVIITFILKYLHDKKSWRILKMYLKKWLWTWDIKNITTESAEALIMVVNVMLHLEKQMVF